MKNFSFRVQFHLKYYFSLKTTKPCLKKIYSKKQEKNNCNSYPFSKHRHYGVKPLNLDDRLQKALHQTYEAKQECYIFLGKIIK